VEFDPNNYNNRADVLLSMWMDNILTDGEYYLIMNKLNKEREME
jgi:hypothetical protein